MKTDLATLSYIGGPTVIFEIGGLRFMTDPTLDPAGSIYHLPNHTAEKTEGPAKIDIGKIDIVLLSHDQHKDNLDNAGRLLLNNVSKTYTTVSGAERLKGTSIGLAPWQRDTIVAPDGTKIIITATPARHGPAGTEKMQGEVIGFILTVQGGKPLEIYITGDTTYYEGVAEVAKRYNPHYVFIFAGGAKPIGPFFVTMDTNDAMDTALAFPNSIIIPLHCEGWKHYTQNGMDIKTSYEFIGIEQRLKILEAGKKINL